MNIIDGLRKANSTAFHFPTKNVYVSAVLVLERPRRQLQLVADHVVSAVH